MAMSDVCQIKVSILCVLLFILCVDIIVAQDDLSVEVTPAITNEDGECPSDDARQALQHLLQNMTHEILKNNFGSPISQICGPGPWRRVFYLNASNSNESCPGDWNTATHPIRACHGDSISCRSTFSDNINTTYSKVCGRL